MRTSLLLLLLSAQLHAGPLFLMLLQKPAVSSTGGATITYLASVSAALGINGGSTSGINATGGTAVVANLNYYSGAVSLTFNDSNGNTYTPLTAQTDTSSGVSRLYYCGNATCGSGMTWTIGGTGVYASVEVTVYTKSSGALTLDSQTGTTNVSSNTIQPGSLSTSGTATELYVSGIESADTAPGTTVDSSVTIRGNIQGSGGTNYGGAIGQGVTTGTTTINPTWTNSSAGSTGMAATAAFFK
jgi:hypothetical protein